jgi:hypothetical protein
MNLSVFRRSVAYEHARRLRRGALHGLCTTLGVLGALGCSAYPASAPTASGAGAAGSPSAASGSASLLPSVSDAGSNPLIAAPAPLSDACSTDRPFKPAGCPCQAGQSAACWTGPAAKRNVGACHDGTQTCGSGSEFNTWQPCSGEELNCGDPPASPPPPPVTPPPPPPPTKCGCTPGVVIQCDEDCAALLFCSLTAQKTCMPDGTWGPCREAVGGIGNVLAPDGGVAGLLGAAASIVQPVNDAGVPINGPGPCRSMFHGCADMGILSEVFTGDCSQAFPCGHAPPRD